MSLGTKPAEVPVLSDALIKLADLCARELWVGIDYQSGKPQHVSVKNKSDKNTAPTVSPLLSDERLLEMFALPFYSHANVHSQRKKIPLPILHVDPYFLKIAGLTRGRKQTEDDVKNGINTLLSVIAADYRGYINGKSNENSLDKTAQYASQLVEEFGLTDNINRRALTFRILFFAIPDFPCFNYGDDIANALKLKTTDDDFIAKFIAKLDRGYKLNWERLSQYEMPLPTHLDSTVWIRAKEHGWWQRRIYDLALMMHFALQKNAISPKNKAITPYPRVMRLFYADSLPYA